MPPRTRFAQIAFVLLSTVFAIICLIAMQTSLQPSRFYGATVTFTMRPKTIDFTIVGGHDGISCSKASKPVSCDDMIVPGKGLVISDQSGTWE